VVDKSHGWRADISGQDFHHGAQITNAYKLDLVTEKGETR
jgi:hypothetical protein